MKRRRRPEEAFVAVKGVRLPDSDRSEAGYDKRATTLSVIASAEEKEADTGGLLSTQLFVPNEEQLAKINQFTLRNVSAAEVACFTTHSCNDIPDRDDDKFTTSTVKEFATLPQPYSPTGKGFMVSHDTSKLAVGRIFDSGTGTFTYEAQKHTKLTNDVYIPRTVAANADFIENMEMGINWAVSVGVMLGGATCSVGKEHDWGWSSWWCSEGHEKGLFYDPDSDEEDSWGWPMPISESAKNAVKTIRNFQKAKDMYELSMVYLGAQYMAGLADKDPAFDGVLKAASSRHIPVIGLRREESEKMPLPRVPEKLRSAAKNHNLKEENGTFSWVDADRLVWSFTPGEDGEPVFLGKRPENGMTQAELNAKIQEIKAKTTEIKGEMEKPENKDAEAVPALVNQLNGLLVALDDAMDQGDVDAANPLVDQAQSLVDQILDALYEDEPTDDNNSNSGEWEDNNAPGNPENKSHSHYHEHKDGTGHSHTHNHSGGSYDHGAEDLEVSHTHTHESTPSEGDTVSKKAVMAALERFPSLPESLKQAVGGLSEDSKSAVETLLHNISKEFDSLSKRAENGDAYVKRLRSDVLDWYRKAKSDPRSDKGVDVSKVERLLERVGDDPDVMEALIDDYRSEAQTRFPSGVRRSSTEDNFNSPSGDDVDERKGDIETRIDGGRVKRIHG